MQDTNASRKNNRKRRNSENFNDERVTPTNAQQQQNKNSNRFGSAEDLMQEGNISPILDGTKRKSRKSESKESSAIDLKPADSVTSLVDGLKLAAQNNLNANKDSYSISPNKKRRTVQQIYSEKPGEVIAHPPMKTGTTEYASPTKKRTDSNVSQCNNAKQDNTDAKSTSSTNAKKNELFEASTSKRPIVVPRLQLQGQGSAKDASNNNSVNNNVINNQKNSTRGPKKNFELSFSARNTNSARNQDNNNAHGGNNCQSKDRTSSMNNFGALVNNFCDSSRNPTPRMDSARRKSVQNSYNVTDKNAKNNYSNEAKVNPIISNPLPNDSARGMLSSGAPSCRTDITENNADYIKGGFVPNLRLPSLATGSTGFSSNRQFGPTKNRPGSANDMFTKISKSSPTGSDKALGNAAGTMSLLDISSVAPSSRHPSARSQMSANSRRRMASPMTLKKDDGTIIEGETPFSQKNSNADLNSVGPKSSNDADDLTSIHEADFSVHTINSRNDPLISARSLRRKKDRVEGTSTPADQTRLPPFVTKSLEFEKGVNLFGRKRGLNDVSALSDVEGSRDNLNKSRRSLGDASFLLGDGAGNKEFSKETNAIGGNNGTNASNANLDTSNLLNTSALPASSPPPRLSECAAPQARQPRRPHGSDDSLGNKRSPFEKPGTGSAGKKYGENSASSASKSIPIENTDKNSTSKKSVSNPYSSPSPTSSMNSFKRRDMGRSSSKRSLLLSMVDQSRALIQIQKWWRKELVKKEVSKKDKFYEDNISKILKLQAMFRRYKLRKKRLTAALNLQKIFRKTLAASNLRKQKAAEEKLKIDAVITLQAIFKARSASEAMLKKVKSIKKIQSFQKKKMFSNKRKAIWRNWLQLKEKKSMDFLETFVKEVISEWKNQVKAKKLQKSNSAKLIASKFKSYSDSKKLLEKIKADQKSRAEKVAIILEQRWKKQCLSSAISSLVKKRDESKKLQAQKFIAQFIFFRIRVLQPKKQRIFKAASKITALFKGVNFRADLFKRNSGFYETQKVLKRVNLTDSQQNISGFEESGLSDSMRLTIIARKRLPVGFINKYQEKTNDFSLLRPGKEQKGKSIWRIEVFECGDLNTSRPLTGNKKIRKNSRDWFLNEMSSEPVVKIEEIDEKSLIDLANVHSNKNLILEDLVKSPTQIFISVLINSLDLAKLLLDSKGLVESSPESSANDDSYSKNFDKDSNINIKESGNYSNAEILSFDDLNLSETGFSLPTCAKSIASMAMSNRPSHEIARENNNSNFSRTTPQKLGQPEYTLERRKASPMEHHISENKRPGSHRSNEENRKLSGENNSQNIQLEKTARNESSARKHSNEFVNANSYYKITNK